MLYEVIYLYMLLELLFESDTNFFFTNVKGILIFVLCIFMFPHWCNFVGGLGYQPKSHKQ